MHIVYPVPVLYTNVERMCVWFKKIPYRPGCESTPGKDLGNDPQTMRFLFW
jgi:hypothetical protein